ncbi:MAG TPA: hypothetical protein VLF21_03710 [Candidatus Saccharimonadales bacterium]|nr:hypothetical protein [Candidatus Saccharimonadales bacterium]
MAPIEHISLQSLSGALGEELAIRSCAPVAFYMLLKAYGYLPAAVEPDEFCFSLDRARLSTTNADWSRPALTRYLREKYLAKIVSWQLYGDADIGNMKQAGYLKTDDEVNFFLHKVRSHQAKELIRQGHPMIVTMKPGFGSDENKNIHAIIITDWADDKVTVVDPDARSAKSEYEPARVEDYISQQGGGTIILPRT